MRKLLAFVPFLVVQIANAQHYKELKREDIFVMKCKEEQQNATIPYLPYNWRYS